jgi:hypothetical protein
MFVLDDSARLSDASPPFTLESVESLSSPACIRQSAGAGEAQVHSPCDLIAFLEWEHQTFPDAGGNGPV